MGWGHTSGSSSSSRPLTAQERQGYLGSALAPIAGINPEFDAQGNVINAGDIVGYGMETLQNMGYQAPEFAMADIINPGAFQQKDISTAGYNDSVYLSDPAAQADFMGYQADTAGMERSPVVLGSYNGETFDPGEFSQKQIYDVGFNDRYASAGGPSSAVDSGFARALHGGDYNALQQSILESRVIPLEYAMRGAQEQVDQDLADRGLYSSGLAVRAKNDVQERFAPVLASAAADAVTQRYGLQAQDLGNVNQYELGRAGMLNSANQAGDQFRLADTAGLNSFNSGLNQSNLARAQMLNNNTADANSYNLQRAAALNEQVRFGNQFGLENAKIANSGNQFNAGSFNDLSRFNAGANTEASRFGAGAYNTASQFNAGAKNQNSQFNSTASNAAVNNANQFGLNQAQMINQNTADPNSYYLQNAQFLASQAQNNANQYNNYAMENSMRNYNSSWAPLNYLQGVYNGTGGSVNSSSGGGGYSVNI